MSNTDVNRYPNNARRGVSFWMCGFLLGLLLLTPLHAEVHQPNGEYRTSSTDLRVKVLGGTVTVDRTWQAINVNKGQFRWYLNPAWADLDLEIDSTSGAIRSVSRGPSSRSRAMTCMC